MGIQLRLVKVLIAFCQVNGSVAGGIQATFITEPIEMQMGTHLETLIFIVAPGKERPLVLRADLTKEMEPPHELEEGAPNGPPSPRMRENPEGSTPMVGIGTATQEKDLPTIRKEYQDLREVSMKRGQINSLPTDLQTVL